MLRLIKLVMTVDEDYLNLKVISTKAGEVKLHSNKLLAGVSCVCWADERFCKKQHDDDDNNIDDDSDNNNDCGNKEASNI